MQGVGRNSTNTAKQMFCHTYLQRNPAETIRDEHVEQTLFVLAGLSAVSRAPTVYYATLLEISAERRATYTFVGGYCFTEEPYMLIHINMYPVSTEH